MSLEKKLPRFVPTLTEVVPSMPQSRAEIPIVTDQLREASEHEPNLVLAKAMVAAETFIAHRMPELVSQHMAACELQLRQELEIIIKSAVTPND